MKKIFTIILISINITYAQVGISTVNPQGALDIVSTTDGVLIPRLTSNPTSAVNGKIYYNTASNEFIYYNNIAWVPMSNIYNSNGTLSSTRTVTQNAMGLTFNSTTGKFEYTTTSGNFLITNGSTSTTLFSAHGVNNNVSIGTISNNLGKFFILNEDTTNNYDAFRIRNIETDAVAYGLNLQMESMTTSTGFNLDNYGTGRSFLGFHRNTTTTSAPFLLRNAATSSTLMVTNESGINTRGAIVGTNNRNASFLNSLSGYIGIQGEARTTSTSFEATGVVGAGFESSITLGTSGASGGFFYLMDGTPAIPTTTTSSKVATRNSGTNYKILGITGAPVVSTSRENHQGEKVILFAPESPMPTYNDFGKGKLINGRAHVILDPAYASMIYVNENENAPLRIIVQLEGDCKGVYVTNKTNTSFDVIELQGGNSNVSFTYQVVGNSKNYIDPKSGIQNRLQDIRYPELKENNNKISQEIAY